MRSIGDEVRTFASIVGAEVDAEVAAELAPGGASADSAGPARTAQLQMAP